MLIKRRNFLKSLSLGASAPLLLPMLKQMNLHADDKQAQQPTRFIFAIKGSGLEPERLAPRNYVGKYNRGRCDYLNAPVTELNDNLKSLEPFKDQVSFVLNSSGAITGGSHDANYGALGAYNGGPGINSPGRILGPTIDWELASLMPDTPFQHIGLTSGGGSQALHYAKLSAKKIGVQIPYLGSYQYAYNTLFASGLNSTEANKAKFLDHKLLDFMKDDIKGFQKQLPSEGKEKLDHYLSAFENLQRRNEHLKTMSETIRKNSPEFYTGDYEHLEDRHEASMDLAAAALICGLTHVVVFPFNGVGGIYSRSGMTSGLHNIGHGEDSNGISNTKCQDLVIEHQANVLARLAKKLKETPEGSGNMLDNTVIIWTTDNGEKHHTKGMRWPFVMIGGASGRLNTVGRYIQYPYHGSKGSKSMGNFYTTLRNAFTPKSVKPIEHFGQVTSSMREMGHVGQTSELIKTV